jgi:tetratricopeptide (TPR) repeat protein
VNELRKLVEELRPIHHEYPETVERFAIALLELSDSHRAAAIALDPAVRVLPAPMDLKRDASSPPGAGDESAGDRAWIELTPDGEPRVVSAPPPRDAITLARIDPAARRRLEIADRLSTEALGWLRRLADSPRAKERALDRVLFELASLEEDLGQYHDARATYLRLIKHFPTSELVPYAWLSFGHRFSEALKLDEAASCFEKVLALSTAKVAAIAAHQLALVRNEQKRPDEAWAAITRAVLLAREHAPDLLEGICADAKRLRPGERPEGCVP